MKAKTLWLRTGDRRCHLCLTNIERSNQATLDHLIPRSKGGREGWPNVGLAHKPCNHNRGNTLIEPNRLLQLVRSLTGNQSLALSEVYALVYRPLDARCDEFVSYALCNAPARFAAKYTEVEGWTPKCATHIQFAQDAKVQTMTWHSISREMQWEIFTRQSA